MIITNYFGGGGGDALTTGWNDFWTAGAYSQNKKAIKSQQDAINQQAAHIAFQQVLAEKNQKLQDEQLSERKSYLAALLDGKIGRESAQKNLDASDLAAQVIAGREGNRQAALSRAEALAGARQGGAGGPLAAIMAAAAAAQGAEAGRSRGYNTGMGTYTQENANTNNALNSMAGGAGNIAAGAQSNVASLTNAAAGTAAQVAANQSNLTNTQLDNNALAPNAIQNTVGKAADIGAKYLAGL